MMSGLRCLRRIRGGPAESEKYRTFSLAPGEFLSPVPCSLYCILVQITITPHIAVPLLKLGGMVAAPR